MKLRDCQVEMREFIVAHPKCALWADVGLGKSAGTLFGLLDLFNTLEIGKVLIVGPKRVVAEVWPDEIAAWALRKKLSYTHLTGSPTERKAILAGKLPDITFITRDLIVGRDGKRKTEGLLEHFRSTRTAPPWDTIVIDESSSFAEAGSKRWKAMNVFCLTASRVIQLTGTPASGSLMKLWGQMFLLDQGKALGRTITGYRNTFFDFNPYSNKYELKPGMDKTIHRLVAPYVLRIDAQDYLDMPPTLYNSVKVHLPTALHEQYKHFEREFLLKLESGGVLAANNAGTLSGKLRQFCNGAVYNDLHQYHTIHDLKLDALAELLEELDGEPCLLYYQFVSDLKRIQARFPAARVLDYPGALDGWRKGEVPLLIAHPLSAAHGLNIHQGGAKHTVYFGLPWSLEQYDQSFGRLNGARAKETSFVHHILCVGTIEQRIAETLQLKARTQHDLLLAVKGLRQREAA